MGVRRGRHARCETALDGVIARRGDDMRQILRVIRSTAAMIAQERGSAFALWCCGHGRVRPSAAARRDRRRRRRPIVTAVGPIPGPPTRPTAPGESVRERSHGHGRRTPAVRSLQLLGLSRRAGRRRHGAEPARRGLDLRKQRRAAVQLDRRRTRARHAVVADASDAGSDRGSSSPTSSRFARGTSPRRRRPNRGHACMSRIAQSRLVCASSRCS